MGRSVFAAFCLLIAGVAEARMPQGKAPLMPSRLVQPGESVSSSAAPEATAAPVRLGLQAGGVGTVKDSRPFVLGEAFAGLRLFSRFSLGSRFYLLPSVGYYRRVSEALLASSGSDIIEIAANLQYALFRLGPVAFMAGVNQRVGWRSGSTFASGNLFYRVGPGGTLNIRLSKATSILLGTDYGFSLGSANPEWTAHAGLLIAW